MLFLIDFIEQNVIFKLKVMIKYHKKLINKYKLEKLINTEDFNLSNIIIEFYCQIINLKYIENEN